MLATYMRRMRDNNLEIGIVGSSCRPQNGDSIGGNRGTRQQLVRKFTHSR